MTTGPALPGPTYKPDPYIRRNTIALYSAPPLLLLIALISVMSCAGLDPKTQALLAAVLSGSLAAYARFYLAHIMAEALAMVNIEIQVRYFTSMVVGGAFGAFGYCIAESKLLLKLAYSYVPEGSELTLHGAAAIGFAAGLLVRELVEKSSKKLAGGA